MADEDEAAAVAAAAAAAAAAARSIAEGAALASKRRRVLGRSVDTTPAGVSAQFDASAGAAEAAGAAAFA